MDTVTKLYDYNLNSEHSNTNVSIQLSQVFELKMLN